MLDADLYGPDVPRMLGLTRTVDAKSITIWDNSRKEAIPQNPSSATG